MDEQFKVNRFGDIGFDKIQLGEDIRYIVA